MSISRMTVNCPYREISIEIVDIRGTNNTTYGNKTHAVLINHNVSVCENEKPLFMFRKEASFDECCQIAAIFGGEEWDVVSTTKDNKEN